MRGQIHADVRDVQAMQAEIQDRLPEEPILLHEGEHEVFAIIMTQLSLKRGLKVFSDKGKTAALKEMTQLHDMSAFFPRDPRSLSREERVKALSSLIFLKEKRDASI